MKKLIIVLFALSLFSCSKLDEDEKKENVIDKVFTKTDEYATNEISIIEKDGGLQLKIVSSFNPEDTYFHLEKQISSESEEVYFLQENGNGQYEVIVIRDNKKIIALSYKKVGGEDNIYYLKE